MHSHSDHPDVIPRKGVTFMNIHGDIGEIMSGYTVFAAVVWISIKEFQRRRALTPEEREKEDDEARNGISDW